VGTGQWTIEDIAANWRARWVRGASARCPACEHPRVALLVALHAGENGYRWCCVRCGRESPRFLLEGGRLWLDGREGTVVLEGLPPVDEPPAVLEELWQMDHEMKSESRVGSDGDAKDGSYVVRFLVVGVAARDGIFAILQHEMAQRGAVLVACHMDAISFTYGGARTFDEAFAMAAGAARGLERRVRVFVKDADGARWRFRM
jgi:hypothetical protein